MNKTARTNEPLKATSGGANQSPDTFSNDLVTNEDFNGAVNSSASRGHVKGGSGISPDSSSAIASGFEDLNHQSDDGGGKGETSRRLDHHQPNVGDLHDAATAHPASRPPSGDGDDAGRRKPFQWLNQNLRRFLSFIGPGFLISVAYSKTAPNSISIRLVAVCSY